MKIRLKTGVRVKADAETIYHEVEASKVDGVVDLQTIVDRAKPKDAPLHAEFTWTNREAADKWRLHEARKIVQAIEIIHDEAPPTRAWESVVVVTEDQAGISNKVSERRAFMSIGDIMSDPVQRDELISRAIKDAIAWRRRYSAIQELAQIHAAIDAAAVKVKVA